MSIADANGAVRGFAEAIPETGDIGLFASATSSDTTSMPDDSGFVFKQLTAQMTAAMWTVPPNWTSPTIDITAAIRVDGFTVAYSHKYGYGPTGNALAQLTLRVVGSVSSQSAMVEAAQVAACRQYGSSLYTSYNPAVSQFDETVPVTIQLTVAPWDVITIGVSAELYVGVTTDSDMYLLANFAPQGGQYFPEANIQLLGVMGTC